MLAFHTPLKRKVIQTGLGDHRGAALATEVDNSIEPTSASLYSIAWSYAKAGDYEKALRFAHLETINSKTDDEKAEGLSQEARYLLRLGKYREAVYMNAGDYRAFKIRAKCFRKLGRTRDAEADLHTADIWRTYKNL